MQLYKANGEYYKAPTDETAIYNWCSLMLILEKRFDLIKVITVHSDLTNEDREQEVILCRPKNVKRLTRLMRRNDKLVQKEIRKVQDEIKSEEAVQPNNTKTTEQDQPAGESGVEVRPVNDGTSAQG